MLELGTPAPPFLLPDTDGHPLCVDDFWNAKALLVMFLSNHCPYVKHLQGALVELAGEYQPKGVAMVAIGSNDAERYPDDGPDEIRRVKEEKGYPFPYLYDETQRVARSYRAACTPDFFLFDESRTLVYRGQFDESRPGNGRPITGADLRAALDAVLAGQAPPTEQKPSVGCGIKWKPGNEPDYAD